ncbi:hypothetical protein B0H11DRAFT_884601 [Mycena galericulata]|nr:hypothetical protein B0H11DRAFT_884601 [Mycena galericulata]
MFGVDKTRWLENPSSSPPSSPTAIDASPPSSPGLDLEVEFAGDITRAPSGASPPLHPFAASASLWNPPEYEKGGKKPRRRMSPSSPTRTRMKKRRLEPESSTSTLSSSPRVSITLTEADKEGLLWDTASSRMVDNANGAIYLQDSNLSTIPQQFIRDLNLFCALEVASERLNANQIATVSPPPSARQFNRSLTAPAILGSGLGVARQEIQLYLAVNQISRLPVQLCYVDKLTVLTLRNNKLETLPPAIWYLTNLKTLNVSGNRLQYLPAEISRMSSLETLLVFPNPFKKWEENSPPEQQSNHTKSLQKRIVSQTSLISPVPPLTELAFRLLFSVESGPPTKTNHAHRQLALYNGFPLCGIPPHLGRVFHVIHPGSVVHDVSMDSADDQPSLGLCPSPHHGLSASVFVEPLEERYTWESVIAGHDVGEKVPLKWRGCSRGCLAFLDAEVEHGDLAVDTAKMEVDEGNEEQDGVTLLQFASLTGFGVSDFEDGD